MNQTTESETLKLLASVVVLVLSFIFATIQAVLLWLARKLWDAQQKEIDRKIELAVMNNQMVLQSELNKLALALERLQTQKLDEERRFNDLEERLDNLSKDMNEMTQTILAAIANGKVS